MLYKLSYNQSHAVIVYEIELFLTGYFLNHENNDIFSDVTFYKMKLWESIYLVDY